MGAGAGAVGKNEIFSQYGIKPEKILTINGSYYANLTREESKLNDEVLKGMERYNKFSKEDAVENVTSIKTKSVRQQGTYQK